MGKEGADFVLRTQSRRRRCRGFAPEETCMPRMPDASGDSEKSIEKHFWLPGCHVLNNMGKERPATALTFLFSSAVIAGTFEHFGIVILDTSPDPTLLLRPPSHNIFLESGQVVFYGVHVPRILFSQDTYLNIGPRALHVGCISLRPGAERFSSFPDPSSSHS